MPIIYGKDGEQKFIHDIDVPAWLAEGYSLESIPAEQPKKTTKSKKSAPVAEEVNEINLTED